MSIPKKGSRKIVVNDVEYRWRVRHKTDYWNLMSGDGLNFAVEKQENGNCVLHVMLDGFGHFGSWADNLETLVITPKLVAQAIEIALEKGWQPEQNGKTFELSLNSEEHNF
ncbi:MULTISPECIES: hypothetical protein [unclassified Moraxella]|uniref:hypothetical protein n=1 Tax=unclassified Moraxella TaxID=2685852 RepID=UPI003AF5C59E